MRDARRALMMALLGASIALLLDMLGEEAGLDA